MSVEIILGDCREVMREVPGGTGRFDCIIADPPYGETALDWDRLCDGWERVAERSLKKTGSLWIFGSFRFLMRSMPSIESAGLRHAQEIVWEKHNGSAMHADRFKRVHEFVVQFYRRDAAWAEVYNDVQYTAAAVKRQVRRKQGPAHVGKIGAGNYGTEEGGPRIMRSVIYCPSPRHNGIHPTEKPTALLETLIRTSCPPNGLIGDFFAGGGSCALAARNTGRNYLGTEIRSDYHAAAIDRLKGSLPLVCAA
jgi:site-specific DNA-methyltransferase (adenine-specific)